ncbi:hypothetical protein U5817_01125 [Aromatoleum evansii]|uniref:Histidine kinase domain-containing protein n=1 Tax=Aromatoleum evansii TaxID=59406 RepID=A0ABZ1AQ55_AROEV|nr:hypothetical protein U5817_01125 [Aromatoleum evansii]
MQLAILWQRLRELPGFVAGATAVVAVWLISMLGGLRALDHVYYDFIVGTMGEPSSARYEVLLVETRPGEAHDWPQLGERLFAAGARQLIFVSPLAEAELRGLAAWGDERVLVGRAPLESGDPPQLRAPEALPADLAERLKTALVALPLGEGGSQRGQFGDFRIRPRLLPGIEKAAAVAAGRAPVPPVFGINYHRGTSLPRIGADRLERELPVPELVQGRTVLVGHAAQPWLAHYDAPGMPRGKRLSQLEVHGLALDSLLQDKAVHDFGPIASALALILSGVALVVAFQPLRLFSAFWVSLALIAGSVPFAWLTMRLFDLWPPVLELSLMTALAFPLVYRAKSLAEDRRLRKLIGETSTKLQNRYLPPGFAETDEHWIYVTNLVDQILQSNRTIFLERVPDDHRVREIHALRCSIGDIDEMRRDYQRVPYTLAIEQRGVVEIDVGRRPYLKVQLGRERQFLAPLIFGGEVLGFWAFGLEEERIGDAAHFRAMVDNIAGQIGELLYQRQLWQARRASEGAAWRRYLNDDALALHRRLSQAIVALERRVSSFEHLFAGLSTAAIVFDLFGRVVLVNERMSRLLTDAGLAPYGMTAADLIATLSGQDAGRVRQTVQALLSASAPTVLPAQLPGDTPGHYILSLRSLEQDPESADDTTPFRSHGLLLELVDVTDIHRLYGVKTGLVSYLNHQLNNHLTAVLGATKLLEMNPAALSGMIPLIDAQCRKAATTVERVQDLLTHELQVDFGGSYPVDPREPAARAVDELRARAAERSIGFDVHVPTTPLLAYANPRELQATLATLLDFLLDDAVEGSRIGLNMTDRADHVEIVLTNSGFGLPQERLDASLAAAAPAGDDTFARLRRALQHIGHWGGQTQVSTALGEGFRIALVLRSFQ